MVLSLILFPKLTFSPLAGNATSAGAKFSNYFKNSANVVYIFSVASFDGKGGKTFRPLLVLNRWQIGFTFDEDVKYLRILLEFCDKLQFQIENLKFLQLFTKKF